MTDKEFWEKAQALGNDLETGLVALKTKGAEKAEVATFWTQYWDALRELWGERGRTILGVR